MLDWLQDQGADCARCSERPHVKDCLGCGKPPTRDDDPAKALWAAADNGEFISPLQAIRRGLPPYRSIGYGEIREDWPWCPRWFAAYSTATVGVLPTYRMIRRAKTYRDKNALEGLIPPPWTAGFLDLLDLMDALDKIREAERAAELREAGKRGNR